MLRLRSWAAWATLACALTVLLTASVWLGDSTTELAAAAPEHGVSAHAARAGLSSYFRQQSLAIKRQAAANAAARKKHMTASAAAADLNSFFDSLPTGKNKGGLSVLSKEVKDLSADVKAMLTPMKHLQDKSEAEGAAVQSLSKDTRTLMQDDKLRQSVVAKAAQAAERAAASAKMAASRRARDETVVVRQKLRPAPVVTKTVTKVLAAKEVNPQMHVEGLPPGWKAYMDLRTKYAYFYNKHTGKSSWINPKGSRVTIKGLPVGWEALQDKGGRDYYVNLKSGKSTWEDPRVIPGEKVLAMVSRGARHRAAMHRQAEKMAQAARLAALADDHGVMAHKFPRSQWADKDWMRFLDDGDASAANGDAALLTSSQQLAQGDRGSEQAMPHEIASSSY